MKEFLKTNWIVPGWWLGLILLSLLLNTMRAVGEITIYIYNLLF